MFDFLIIAPLTNLLIGLYQLFGENLGFAIIIFTIILRVALLPLTIRQIKLQKKMAELQPRLQELQSKRKDPSQMTPEEMALMRQTAGGCLNSVIPFVIQIPILLGLNSVIGRIASAQSGDIFNNLLYFDFLKHDASYRFQTMFLGFDLAGIPSKIGFTAQFIPYAILLALLVITQFLFSKMMVAMQNNKQLQKKVEKSVKKKANEKKITKKEQEKIEMQEEIQKMIQLQTKYFIPLAIGIASYSFSAALSLYWLTSNVFQMIQMEIQNRMNDGRIKFGRK